MKKIVIGVVAAVVVLGLLGLVVVFLSLNPIVKKGVETVGPALTKVEVRLGAANISPFSGRGTLTKLFVGNPEGFKTPSAIELGEVTLAVEASSLTKDVIVIDELTIKEPHVTLEGTLTGDNNVSKILANLQAVTGGGGKGTPAAAPAAGGKEKKFIVKKLVFEGGKVSLSLNLPVLGGKAATAPLPPIHAENIGVAENGVSAGQLAVEIVKPMLAGAVSEGGKVIAELTKNFTDLGKQGAEQLNKTIQGGAGELGKSIKDVGGLFKKK